MNKLFFNITRQQLTRNCIRFYKTKSHPYLDPLLDPKYSSYSHNEKLLKKPDDKYNVSRIAINYLNHSKSVINKKNNIKCTKKLERYVENKSLGCFTIE